MNLGRKKSQVKARREEQAQEKILACYRKDILARTVAIKGTLLSS